MAFLELHDIHKSYYLGKEEFPVLKGIDLDFERGELVSILGESGGGKSTLMNIIGGLDRKFTGSVVINGKTLDHSKEKEMDNYRRGMIGYIYQSYNLISHLNIVDNVLVSLDMTKLNGAQRKQRAIDLLKKVGLGDQLKKHPNQLSGGQKQRVAIARALASDPQIIIADEPTGALDSVNTAEVLDLLSDIAKDGKLVIAVTHSQDVASHGTRIVHLVDGKINGDERIKAAYPLPENPETLPPRVLSATASYRNAFKHFSFNFWRNLIIMIGTAIGLFAVLLFSGLGNGVNAFIQNQINSMVNPTSITVMKNPTKKKISMTQMESEMSNMVSDPAKMMIDPALISKLNNLKGVDKVEPGYQFSAYQLSYNQKTKTDSGLQTWTDANTSNAVKNGHAPKNNQIVLSKTQAVTLIGSNNYKSLIGKQIRLSFNWIDNQNRPVQVSKKLTVSGLSAGGQTSSVVGTNYSTMKRMLTAAKASTKPSFVSVKASSTKQVNKVASAIRNVKDSQGHYAFGAITVGDILKTVNQYVSIATTLLSAIAAISLVVSALMIIVTMYMSVSERTKEIGILRALGERRKDIRRLFTAESLFIGFFSAIIALVLAYGGSIWLNHALYHIAKFNMVQITPGNILMTFILAIVISFIAALLPARRASRLNPIDALSAD
ncbi:ABC transporter ATP-binding protein/permease [Secundilactobacillus folii]|uniref:ATP-binding cassette domain-containing protein n=1 Tax=Secundilactobacillus folii TaxID=2678357 RepID=A0A7X2XTM3_9LACO|nr:ABC transporter ATP-binding protein/permease [Secundilactobacillus folii]MTV81386.1 ATP-binding cassette domain-containing protein [Secundilactobacillus folii]